MGLACAACRVIAWLVLIILLVSCFPPCTIVPTPGPIPPIHPTVCTLKNFGIKDGSLWSDASGSDEYMTQALTLSSHHHDTAWKISDAKGNVQYRGSFDQKHDHGSVKCTASGKIRGEDNSYTVTFYGDPADEMIYSDPSIEDGTVTLHLVPKN